MIVDAFLLLNELDVLEIRFNELDPIVDLFVVVESKKTFSNQQKPLLFDLSKYRFKKFLHKTQHIILENLPDGDNPWARELYQRRIILNYFNSRPDNAICMISDVDEIPSADVVSKIGENLESNELVIIKNFFCHGYLNRVLSKKEENNGIAYWGGTRAAKKSFWRGNRTGREETTNFLYGGWHFRNIGGYKSILAKLKSYSHHRDKSAIGVALEKVTEEYVKNRIESGEELCESGFTTMDLKENLWPDYVVKNKEKLKNLLYNI